MTMRSLARYASLAVVALLPANAAPSMAAPPRSVQAQPAASPLLPSHSAPGVSAPASFAAHSAPGRALQAGSLYISALSESGATFTASQDSTYRFTITGTYTISPSMSCTIFTPTLRTVTLPPDATGVDSLAMGPAISHIEVTQATQDEANGVPLVEGKPAFARVYVDCGEGCPSLPGVTGQLVGIGPAGELPALRCRPLPDLRRAPITRTGPRSAPRSTRPSTLLCRRRGCRGP